MLNYMLCLCCVVFVLGEEEGVAISNMTEQHRKQRRQASSGFVYLEITVENTSRMAVEDSAGNLAEY